LWVRTGAYPRLLSRKVLPLWPFTVNISRNNNPGYNEISKNTDKKGFITLAARNSHRMSKIDGIAEGILKGEVLLYH
jgi:hypothetical protein